MISDNPDIAAAQQQRMRDSLRLAETKRKNILETLGKLREQYQRLLRHHELDVELDEHNSRLFNLTKEYATMEKEAEEMDRFETFESIITPFLRMKMIDAEAEENRRAGNDLEQRIRDKSEEIEAQRKRLAEARDENNESEKSFGEEIRLLCRAINLDGAIESQDYGLKHLKALVSEREDYLSLLRNRMQQSETALEVCKNQLSGLTGNMHVLDSHTQMLEDTGNIIARLLRLEELAEDRRQNEQKRDRAVREQTQQNELLGEVYSQYTEITQQIEGIQDEMDVHRTNIRGMQSYDVQEHVIQLKSRLQMLLSAKSLWRRIATGYRTIEEKTQKLTALSQQIETGLRTERELKQKVQHLAQQVDDMRYSLDMSKSQNVIGLRQDLREGVACTVCGATHHPFHSDTMLDQSKLIGDMRGEYETSRLELQVLQKQMDDLHDELTRALGEKVAEQQNLDMVRLRQEEDVNEWNVFSQLDPTFQRCSEEIDGDARMATIRQLIDNAERDERQAKAVLDEFNYHSNQIDILSERISKLEERKDEMTVRMGELNTACQVLTSQLDSTNGVLKMLGDRYHQLYETLTGLITLQDWYETWKQNAEGLRLQLRSMYNQWHKLQQDITRKEEEKTRLETVVNFYRKAIEEISALQETIRESEHSLSDNLASVQEQREQLLGRDDVMSRLEQGLNRVAQTKKNLDDHINETVNLTLGLKTLEGAHANVREMGETLDERSRHQRNQVDEWMHVYNTQHPPVQYAELTEVLTADMDWNERRTRIRENRMQTALEQQRVKSIEASLVALEVDTGTISASELISRKNQTDTEIKNLEQQLRDTDMQIARLEVGLMG